MKIIFVACIFMHCLLAQYQFQGRVSLYNPKAQVLRLRFEFYNAKFLKNQDLLSFWGLGQDTQKCQGVILGKSGEYYLMQIREYNICRQKLALNAGVLLNFSSRDYEETLLKAKEVTATLLQKREILESIKSQNDDIVNDQNGEIEKVNIKYKSIIEGIKKEWNNELKAVVENRGSDVGKSASLQSQLDDLDMELEKYRVESPQFKKDRWSLSSEASSLGESPLPQ
jgi:hypothetical protein